VAGARIVFVNSMSDLFHARVPLEFVSRVFSVIADTPQHTHQGLTKRSARLRKVADRLEWPSNLWMGVSVEDSSVLFRVDDLRTVPSAVRFLSCEPLIGPLDNLGLDGIGWVIAGGESGPGHRPLELSWVTGSPRSLCRVRGALLLQAVGGEALPRQAAESSGVRSGTRCPHRRQRTYGQASQQKRN
jgi:protein gp37